MGARPYVLLSRTRLAVIERVMSDAVRGWQAQWGDAGLRVECVAAGRGDAAGFAPRGAWRGAGQAWQDWNEEMAIAIACGLFGGSAAGLAHTLAARAQDALMAALAVAALPQAVRQARPEEVAPALWQAGSGAVLVRLWCGRQALRLLLSPPAVAALAPVTAPQLAPLAPCPLQSAVGAAAVALPVRLGGVQLPLAALMSVRVGDVILLEAAADQPLQVLAPDGEQTLLYAHLGRVGQALAVEVRH